MAYNAANEERTELLTIQKNERGEYIKGSKIVNKNSGNESIDIRQFYTDKDDKVQPTSKGVRFNSENLLDFCKGIVTALEINEKEELIDFLNDIVSKEDAE